MTLLTVEGIYREGKVELAERPAGVEEATPVLVTFLPPDEPKRAGSLAATEEARREAGRRLVALLEEGLPLGGRPYRDREELHDRADRRASQGDG